MPRVHDRSAGHSVDSIDNDNDNDNDDTEPSPSAAAAAAAANRHRRSHRKSRNGCAECKRRHIRCDEQRPVCAHCAIAQRACIFPPPREKSTRRRGRDRRLEAAITSTTATRHDEPHHHNTGSTAEVNGQSPSTDPDRGCPALGPVPPLLPSFEEAFPGLSSYESGSGAEHDAGALFTAQHLVFLHHAETSTDDCIMARGQTKQVVDIAIRRAADAPYLIDQVLALSALHLATTSQRDPHSSDASPSSSSSSSSPSPSSLRHQATELQTRAVACFTRHARSIPADDTASAIPRFLFAAILSLHVLAETLAEVRHLHHSRFHVFIDRFAECLRLHHGIRAVIRPTWQDLLESELEPLLTIPRDAEERARARGATDGPRTGTDGHLTNESVTGPGTGTGDSRPPDGCAHLLALLDASDLGPSTVHACREAVHRLQWAFELYASLDDPDGGPHAVSIFSVTVGSEYIDVLRRHQPEALVILAHYGVLLHRCRRFWVFGDAGAYMIRAIAQHLGSYWRDAVAWPLQVLQDEHG